MEAIVYIKGKVRGEFCTANDPQIVPQIIPAPELIPPQKVRNGVDFMKSLWMDTYFLNYPS